MERMNRIGAVMREKGVKGKQLAKDLGVAEQTVSYWCTNTRQPKIKTLRKIAAHLKCQPSDLLTDIELS